MNEQQEIATNLAEGGFETEFKNATTITALREFLKRLKMERIKLIAGDSPSLNAVAVMDEQLKLVQWELDRLQAMQSKGRFRAYYAFLKLLDEHYPFKTPVIQYKYMLDDGVSELKKEILSNMLHMAADERVPYLVRIQFETEKLLKNVYATEVVLQEWYSEYNTREEDLFSPEASKHRNLVFRVLTAAKPAVAGGKTVAVAAAEKETEVEVNDDRLREEAMAVEEYDIQNDFYNVFYGRAVKDVLEFLKEQMREYRSAVAVAAGTIAEAVADRQGERDKNISRRDKEVAEIKEFEEMFLARGDGEPCFQLLKSSQPPVIDDSNNFCLGQRSKGAIVAWLDVMKDKNKIWKSLADTTVAAILNNKIKGLNITDRTIRSAQTKLSKNYRAFYRQF